jgi:hypothetical protein
MTTTFLNLKMKKNETKKDRIDLTIIIKIIVDQLKKGRNPRTIHTMNPQQEKLALELAEALNDTSSISFYQSLVVRFSEQYLHDILKKVLLTDATKIRKSKAAFFNYLVHNEKIARNYPGY